MFFIDLRFFLARRVVSLRQQTSFTRSRVERRRWTEVLTAENSLKLFCEIQWVIIVVTICFPFVVVTKGHCGDIPLLDSPLLRTFRWNAQFWSYTFRLLYALDRLKKEGLDMFSPTVHITTVAKIMRFRKSYVYILESLRFRSLRCGR